MTTPTPHRWTWRLPEIPSGWRGHIASMLRALPARVRSRPLPWIGAAAGLTVVLVGGLVRLTRLTGDASLSATVQRGSLTVRLLEGGVLKPAQSLTYRSPLAGREAEIVFLVSEGTLVGEGDLLVRLDTTELERELARAVQELRQAEVDLKLAEADREDGAAAVDSLTEGAGSIEVEETRARLALAEKKAKRLREEYDTLKSLRERGFITQDELDKAGFELEQAETDLGIASRKSSVYIERTHPRERQRATLQLAQKDAQRENVRARVREARERVKVLRDSIEGCSIHARAAGLVVHEDFLGAGTRRKIRAGDRVTGANGLVTIPEVSRMVVETSVRESQVHQVQPGQSVTVLLEAYPDLRLAGRLSRVGTLARSSSERPGDEKRFDVIVNLDSSHPDLRPEMTARVEIVVAERQGVLLAPINAIFDRGGVKVCHVSGMFGSRTRRIRLGAVNEAFAEVLEGLREGDRLSLVDSTTAAPEPDALKAAAPVLELSGATEKGAAPLAPR